MKAVVFVVGAVSALEGVFEVVLEGFDLGLPKDMEMGLDILRCGLRRQGDEEGYRRDCGLIATSFHCDRLTIVTIIL